MLKRCIWSTLEAWKQTFPPLPLPLTDERQLFKCKLSLTNTTLCDTCFNHGNKGAASGRVGAPSLWYSNDGAVQHTKTTTSKNTLFKESNMLHSVPPTSTVNQLNFKVIWIRITWESQNRLASELFEIVMLYFKSVYKHSHLLQRIMRHTFTLFSCNIHSSFG